MTVTVVTDSAAALPGELAARAGVAVVPLWLHVGDDRVRDGDLDLEALVARLDRGADVGTSAPSPGEFAEVIAAAAGDGPAVVLTLAGTMSSTHDAALVAAKDLGPDVVVVDTGTAAGAQGLVVLAAAEAARRGAGLDEVCATADGVARRVRLVATVGDLDRLVRSGRVPAAAGRVGNRLGINPLFEFRDGHPHPLRPALSRDAALDRIVARCSRGARDGGAGLHVAVLHALDPEAAATLDARVRALRPASCFTGPFSPVMVAHTGRGLAGLAWWSEP